MNQIFAYLILNVKMLIKDKLPMIWSVLMPSLILIINRNSIASIIDLRFWWSYIIITSYIFGIGIHALNQKEAGTLKTAFSISNKPYIFFVSNFLTQCIYCIICIFAFNIVAILIYKFNIFDLFIFSLFTLLYSIPFAFFCYNITLLKGVHVNSLSTIANIIIFALFLLLNSNSKLNYFNPLMYFSNSILIQTIEEVYIYLIISLSLITSGLYSIIKFECIPNERR